MNGVKAIGNGTAFGDWIQVLRLYKDLGIKRADSPYASGRRSADWLKVVRADLMAGLAILITEHIGIVALSPRGAWHETR